MVITPLNASHPTGRLDAVDTPCIANSAHTSLEGRVDSCFERALAQVSQSAPSPSTAPVGSVNPMLLHEIALSDGRRRDSEARRHGKALLAALAGMQRAMLNGDLCPSALDQVASLLSSVPPATDPVLSKILQAIAVRAAVELCRHRAA